MDRQELLKFLGSRNGVEDPRHFTGRQGELLACAGLGETTKVVWVFGPRRSGKTAFAQQLCRTVAAQHLGSRVLSIDASNVKTFDELLEAVLRTARLSGSGDPRSRFEGLADSTREGTPTLLVVDEFDRASISLGVDEQALLRRLTTGDRRLSYVFVSRMPPWRIVEEVSDVASRLLGIAQHVPIPQFRVDDVVQLFEMAAECVASPDLAAAARRCWEEVGGHALSVMTLLQRLTIAAMQGELDFDRVLDVLRIELLGQLSSLWRDLRPGTRAILLDDAVMKDATARSDASQEGFISRMKEPLRPRLLMEAGRDASSSVRPAEDSGEMAATARLHDAIFEVNVCVKSRTGEAWFASNDEVRRQHGTMRPVLNEKEFSWAVAHLYKVVYEASRELDPKRNPTSDPMKSRIPAPYWSILRGSEGMECLQAYRSFYHHDADFNRGDGAKGFDRHQRVGKAFTIAIGKERPGVAEDWAKAHLHLLRSLAAAAEALLNAYRQAVA
jgi:hypothetical protein